MDGPKTIITIKSERERQIAYDIIYTCNLKRGTNELIYKIEIESQMQKINLWLPGGKVGKEVEG